MESSSDRTGQRHWGKPILDLFAPKRNSKIKTSTSPVPEPESWKIDSLLQSWDGFPPVCDRTGPIKPIKASDQQGRGQSDSATMATLGMFWRPHQTVRRIISGCPFAAKESVFRFILEKYKERLSNYLVDKINC
ncbi:hypothetical protein LSH36_279g03106 [Paralvinella palmiformis]|uniref:Uncharacterized protein n=1 Tax=Paralvinella palmiformis TaxID=53620 RepID=A0AAD9JJT7_9ANNE|nr:hypothetical protein LSH36_279g03106 [Paralvinella palmiformis]